MPTIQQWHVDTALTQISVNFTNEEFVAERISPVVYVQKESDFFYIFSKQKFRSYDDATRPDTDIQRIELDLDKRGYYFADGHALEVVIPDRIRANADPGAQLDVENTETLTNDILLNEENNLAANFTSAGAPAGVTTVTLSGTSQWSDFVNSDPIVAVEGYKNTVQQQIGRLPNCLLLPRQVFIQVRNHPKVIDRVKYTQAGVRRQLTAQEVADAFEIEEVIVASAVKQNVNEGQADSLAYIWGKNAALFYKPRRPGLREISFFYTFVWLGQGTSYLVKRYREENRNSEVLQVQKWYAQSLVAPGAGLLIFNAVA